MLPSSFMFTGIISAIGTVKKVQAQSDFATFAIACPGMRAKLGDSIAINGVCLTVRAMKGTLYTFDAVKETLTRTTLGTLAPGMQVNLERSLRMGDGLDGHLVLGHVDAVGTVKKLTRKGSNTDLIITFPTQLKKFIAEKGSITIDGVSLTVTACTAQTLTVTLVPHTLTATTLGNLAPGSRVNLEVDVIARYVYNRST